jgi:uncharacterized protein YkwD
LGCLIFSGCVEHTKSEPLVDHNEPIVKNDFSDSQILLLELHNKERKNKNLIEFVLDKELCEYAQKHAEQMSNKNFMYHSKMSDLIKISNSSLVGENVAWGQAIEKDVVNSWMRSPMHRWNILGKSYTKIGFGIAKNEDGSIYWCAVFSNKEA